MSTQSKLQVLSIFLPSSMDSTTFYRTVRGQSEQITLSSQNAVYPIDRIGLDHVTSLVAEMINMTTGSLQQLQYSDYMSLLATFIIARKASRQRLIRRPLLVFLIVSMASTVTAATDRTTGSGSQNNMTSSPAAKIQAGLDTAWQTLFPIMPYIIGLVGLVRVAWMISHKPVAPENPVYTWALSTIVAAFWLAVRSREKDPSTVEAHLIFDPEAIILVAFLSSWASFVADSQRFVIRRALYLLLSVFIGGTAGLLIAALTLLSEPKKVETRAVIMYECRASSLIPLTLSFATSVTYIFLRYCMDADFSVENIQCKASDDNIAMQDLEAGVASRQDETPVVDRGPIDDAPQLGAVVPQVGPVWVGGAAAVETFTLDDSIDSNDGISSNGDVGLMDISNPSPNAAPSALCRATGFENRTTSDAC
jgi:hypothetical protein